jgi:hypothetical protein
MVRIRVAAQTNYLFIEESSVSRNASGTNRRPLLGENEAEEAAG